MNVRLGRARDSFVCCEAENIVMWYKIDGSICLFDSKTGELEQELVHLPVAVPMPVYVTLLEVESLQARILIVLSFRTVSLRRPSK